MAKKCAALVMLASMFTLSTVGGVFAQSTSTYGQRIGDDPFAEEPIVADPARGEKLFKNCSNCHTTAPNEKKIGPSLAGLIGRQPGSVLDFGYSQDMIDFGRAGNYWTEETLDVFLTQPRAMLQRTKMAFPGFKKEQDRADLIAFLTNL